MLNIKCRCASAVTAGDEGYIVSVPCGFDRSIKCAQTKMCFSI